MRVELTALQPFPSAEKFRTLSLKTRPIAELTTLALTIKQNAELCDIQTENHAFIPYLTLGKINNQNNISLETLGQIKTSTVRFNANTIQLFKNELSNSESNHITIASYSLK